MHPKGVTRCHPEGRITIINNVIREESSLARKLIYARDNILSIYKQRLLRRFDSIWYFVIEMTKYSPNVIRDDMR